MAFIVQDVSESQDHMPIVRDLFREYAAELGVNLNFQGFEAELAALPGCYSAPRGCILLAMEGATVLGCIALRPLDGEIGEVKRMYVRAAHRRGGIGRGLFDRLLEVAAGAGYRRLRLDTLESMAGARRLYESRGFTPISPYYDNPIPNVAYYELQLQPPASGVA